MAPQPKKGEGYAEKSYSVGDREAFKTPVQISAGGLQTICPGEDGERATNTPPEAL